MLNKFSKIFIVLTTCILMSNESSAQDPAFSQFYANPLYLNPAFAGTNECPRVNLNYRDQWPGIGRTYITNSVSYDQHISSIGGGIGVLVSQDRAGAGNLNTTNIGLQYSYRLKVNNQFAMKAGFEASYRMIQLDWTNLTFGDMIDPQDGFVFPTNEKIGTNPTTKSFPDFSAGLLGYSKNLYFGFAAHHLTGPNQGFISESELPTKITLHAGGNIAINKYSNNSFIISPNFLYQSQGEFQQFNYGIYAKKGPVVGGLWSRHSLKNIDSFIIMIGLIQNSFKFGYSYDVTISDLKNSNTLGAHEISFTLFLPCRSKGKTYNTISCPQF